MNSPRFNTDEGAEYVRNGWGFPVKPEGYWDEIVEEGEPGSEGVSAGFAALFALIAGICLCAAGYFLTA
jgi:hypothetical protein